MDPTNEGRSSVEGVGDTSTRDPRNYFRSHRGVGDIDLSPVQV